MKKIGNDIEQEFYHNNRIYYKNPASNYEEWCDYDTKDNCIHYRNNDGLEIWRQYDNKNRLIYIRDNQGFMKFIEYASDGITKANQINDSTFAPEYRKPY